MTEREMRLLFEHFDPDHSGEISYDEFIWGGVAEPMNERRRGMVMLAFTVLDADGSGEVHVDEIRDKYDASQSEEVKRGQKTEEEV